MKFIDMHCDTLMLAYENQQETLYEVDGMLDVKRMAEAGQDAQFFAIFLPPEDPADPYAFSEDLRVDDDTYIKKCIEIFQRTMDQHGDLIAPAYSKKDLDRNQGAGLMSGFLTIEDGRSVQGSLDKLEVYYEAGIRLITLTWNHENCFGFPNSFDPQVMEKGLHPFGKEAIEKMNDLGMIIDVSHLSDGGFYDVLEISKVPFTASHSNARALSPHPRNLTDDMIRALAQAGGVMGLNFAPAFLDAQMDGSISRISDMVRHVLHILDVGGSEVLVLGSDFDGVGGDLEINDPRKVPQLFEALSVAGVSDAILEKIAYQNMEAFLDRTL